MKLNGKVIGGLFALVAATYVAGAATVLWLESGCSTNSKISWISEKAVKANKAKSIAFYPYSWFLRSLIFMNERKPLWSTDSFDHISVTKEYDGWYYEQLGEFSKAEAIYQSLIAANAKSKNENYQSSLSRLSRVYLLQGKTKEAEALLNQMQTLASTKKLSNDWYFPFYRRLAWLNVQEGDLVLAEKYAKLAVAKNSNFAIGHIMLGEILEMQGKSAEKEWQKVRELFKKNPDDSDFAIPESQKTLIKLGLKKG